MIKKSEFKAAWWLSNPHAQTIYPSLVKIDDPPVTKLEQLNLPDGDFINLAWAEGELSSDSPLVIIVHGLCGGLKSSYVPRLMNALNQHGFRAVLMHLRGAGDTPNRTPKAYHSGDTDDLDFFLKHLTLKKPQIKKAVVGISLGGNILLKWLGEQHQEQLIVAGVAVSVPFDIRLAATRMCRGFSRMYQFYLLRQMKELYQQKIQAVPHQYPKGVDKMDTYDCFWTWDEFITAPLHGFPNVHSYYRQASSKYYLKDISTPSLIIHAVDDPFMMPEAIPYEQDLSSDVVLELSEKGGHVGFITGQIPGKGEYWLDQRIPAYLSEYLAS